MQKSSNIFVVCGIFALFGWIALFGEARATGRLNDYLGKAQSTELVPGANRLGPPQGDPAIAPAYKDDQLLGYVYLNSDFANATGYSGKPIQILIGISSSSNTRNPLCSWAFRSSAFWKRSTS